MSHSLWRSLNLRAPRLFLSMAAAVRWPLGLGVVPALPSALPLLAFELDLASFFRPCTTVILTVIKISLSPPNA